MGQNANRQMAARVWMLDLFSCLKVECESVAGSVQIVLAAFVNWRETAIGFVIYLSVCKHISAGLSLNGVLWNFMLGILWKSVGKIQISLIFKKNTSTFHEDLSASYCGRRHSVTTNRSLEMKWYQAGRIAQEVESSWNVMAHGDAREGEWMRNWRMEWVASTLHTTSEHGVSSITTADAHTSAASSRLNWRPRRFKWTRPFRRKTISGFCAYAIIFQTQYTNITRTPRSFTLHVHCLFVCLVFLSIRNYMPLCNSDLVPIELSTVRDGRKTVLWLLLCVSWWEYCCS